MMFWELGDVLIRRLKPSVNIVVLFSAKKWFYPLKKKSNQNLNNGLPALNPQQRIL